MYASRTPPSNQRNWFLNKQSFMVLNMTINTLNHLRNQLVTSTVSKAVSYTAWDFSFCNHCNFFMFLKTAPCNLPCTWEIIRAWVTVSTTLQSRKGNNWCTRCYYAKSLLATVAICISSRICESRRPCKLQTSSEGGTISLHSQRWNFPGIVRLPNSPITSFWKDPIP